MTESVLTTEQAAALLGKSPRQVRRDAAAGLLPGVIKLPGQTGPVIFDRSVFEAYLYGRGVLRGVRARTQVVA